MRGIPVTVDGVLYPSIRALAEEHGISPNSIHTRMSSGIPVENALTETKGRTLSKIKTRGEWLVSLGWSIAGLCTSAKWEQWGHALSLLYRDHSTIAIASIFGVAPRVIQMDLKAFGIETRGKGGANHRTIEHYRRVQRVAINEVQELQMERRRRVSEQNGGRLRGLEA
jgi:hypothetical protein